MAIRHVGVHEIVGEVADECRRTTAVENEQAVVMQLRRPDVDRPESKAGAEIEFLPVADAVIREHPPLRPFVAEHRPDDAVLEGIVTTDDVVDTGLGDDRNVEAGGHRGEPGIVVRVRMREQDGNDRLADRVGAPPQFRRGGYGERAVDDDDAVLALDDVGVHREGPRLLETVDLTATCICRRLCRQRLCKNRDSQRRLAECPTCKFQGHLKSPAWGLPEGRGYRQRRGASQGGGDEFNYLRCQ